MPKTYRLREIARHQIFQQMQNLYWKFEQKTIKKNSNKQWRAVNVQFGQNRISSHHGRSVGARRSRHPPPANGPPFGAKLHSFSSVYVDSHMFTYRNYILWLFTTQAIETWFRVCLNLIYVCEKCLMGQILPECAGASVLNCTAFSCYIMDKR